MRKTVHCAPWLATQTTGSVCYSHPSSFLDSTPRFSHHFVVDEVSNGAD